MREVKFKLWLPMVSKMTYALPITDWANGAEQITVSEKCVWLQYVGLKDKNGKEIYEGDVTVAYVDGKSCIGEIKFNNGAFTLLDRWVIHFDEMEVIGNIYEHPELIKEAHVDVSDMEE